MATKPRASFVYVWVHTTFSPAYLVLLKSTVVWANFIAIFLSAFSKY